MLLIQRTLIGLMVISNTLAVANAQVPPARAGRAGDRGSSRPPAPAPQPPPAPAPEAVEAPLPERENREGRNRPAPPPERPVRPPRRDVDQDGIPDRRERTRQYVDVHYEAIHRGICLEPGYGYTVNPSCSYFRGCQSNDFRAPLEPRDCGSVTESINGETKTLQLTSEKSTTATFTSTRIETEKVCRLVQLPESDCRETRLSLYRSAGTAYIQYVDIDGNVLSRDRDSFVKDVFGSEVHRVVPQDWDFSYPQRELDRTSTTVQLNVLPLDFPLPYTFSASVSQKSDNPAQLSFRSKYFSHDARLVSDKRGAQIFEVSSKVQPIPAENVTTSFNPEDYTVTITDSSISELGEIDGKNSATYSIAVYANWTKFSDEKLGKIAEKVVVNSKGSNTLVVDLKQEFLGNPKSKFVKEKFDGGGKTWEAYVEVSTQRTNKYVRNEPSDLYVVKSAIGKKKILRKVEPGFTKFENYRPKQI